MLLSLSCCCPWTETETSTDVDTTSWPWPPARSGAASPCACWPCVWRGGRGGWSPGCRADTATGCCCRGRRSPGSRPAQPSIMENTHEDIFYLGTPPRFVTHSHSPWSPTPRRGTCSCGWSGRTGRGAGGGGPARGTAAWTPPRWSPRRSWPRTWRRGPAAAPAPAPTRTGQTPPSRRPPAWRKKRRCPRGRCRPGRYRGCPGCGWCWRGCWPPPRTPSPSWCPCPTSTSYRDLAPPPAPPPAPPAGRHPPRAAAWRTARSGRSSFPAPATWALLQYVTIIVNSCQPCLPACVSWLCLKLEYS